MNIADPIVSEIVSGPPVEKPTAAVYIRTTPARRERLKEIAGVYGQSQTELVNALFDRLFESYDAAIAAGEKSLAEEREFQERWNPGGGPVVVEASTKRKKGILAGGRKPR